MQLQPHLGLRALSSGWKLKCAIKLEYRELKMVRMGSNGDSRGSLAGRGDNGNTDGTLESPEMGIIPEFQDGQAGRDHAGALPAPAQDCVQTPLECPQGGDSTPAPVQEEFLGSIPAHSFGVWSRARNEIPLSQLCQGYRPPCPQVPLVVLNPTKVCCGDPTCVTPW